MWEGLSVAGDSGPGLCNPCCGAIAQTSGWVALDSRVTLLESADEPAPVRSAR
jgi:hypothetical protein